MVMAAVNAPNTVGAKCPWIAQVAPPARLDPQVFANTNEEAFAPVTPMLAMAKFAPPVLVKVTCCDALVLALHHNPRRQVGHAHRRVGGVHVLPALAAGAIRIDAQ